MGFKDAFRSSNKKQRLAERAALEAEIASLRDVLGRSGDLPAELEANASNTELAREAERLKIRIEARYREAETAEKELYERRSAGGDSAPATSHGIADNEREILAFWRETEREDVAFERAQGRKAAGLKLENDQEALALKREMERAASAAKSEADKNSVAFRSVGLTIFGVAVIGIIIIVVIRETTDLVIRSLEVISGTLTTPTFTSSAVTIVLGVGATFIVGSVAQAHTIHSNNARSVAEKSIEAQKDLEQTRLRIESGQKKPLSVEFPAQSTQGHFRTDERKRSRAV